MLPLGSGNLQTNFSEVSDALIEAFNELLLQFVADFREQATGIVYDNIYRLMGQAMRSSTPFVQMLRIYMRADLLSPEEQKKVR
jgi:hypothetical protein